MILTAAAVAAVARQAGFLGNALVTAVAVAHAESGFDTAAVGDVDLTEKGERSVGLWQVNWRPTRDQRGGLRDPGLNLDPLHNAVAAYSISGLGRSFAPWSTYGSGAYRAFMGEAAAAVAGQEDTMAAKMLGLVACPTGGYWLVTDDGAVFAFGAAPYEGRIALDSNGNWQPIEPEAAK